MSSGERNNYWVLAVIVPPPRRNKQAVGQTIMSLVSDGVCKFVQTRFVDFKSVQSEGYLGSVESMLAQSFQSAQEVLHVQRRETPANDIGDIGWYLLACSTYDRLRSQGFPLP